MYAIKGCCAGCSKHGVQGLGGLGDLTDALVGGSMMSVTMLIIAGVVGYMIFKPEVQLVRKKRRIRRGRAEYAKAKSRIEKKYGKEAFATTAF